MAKNNDVLKALLGTEQVIEEKYPMKRFGVDFVLRALDGEVIDQMTEQAKVPIIKNGKIEDYKVDEQKFSSLILLKGCVVPDWSEPALLEHYKTNDATVVIKKRLLAGEIAKLSSKVLELSGYGDDDETVEEIKN